MFDCPTASPQPLSEWPSRPAYNRSRDAHGLIVDLEAAPAEVTRLYERWQELTAPTSALCPLSSVFCLLSSVLCLPPSTINSQPSTIWRHSAQRRTARGQRGGGPTLGKRRRMAINPESGCIGPPHTPVTTAGDRKGPSILSLLHPPSSSAGEDGASQAQRPPGAFGKLRFPTCTGRFAVSV